MTLSEWLLCHFWQCARFPNLAQFSAQAKAIPENMCCICDEERQRQRGGTDPLSMYCEKYMKNKLTIQLG